MKLLTELNQINQFSKISEKLDSIDGLMQLVESSYDEFKLERPSTLKQANELSKKAREALADAKQNGEERKVQTLMRYMQSLERVSRELIDQAMNSELFIKQQAG